MHIRQDLSKSFCDRVGWTSSRDVVLCAAGDGASGSRKEEKRWQVSVKMSAKNALMCGGWTEFAQDNGLAVSETLTPASSCHSHLVQAQAPTSFESTSSGATGAGAHLFDLSNLFKAHFRLWPCLDPKFGRQTLHSKCHVTL
jgi:hypothetical protein